MLRNKRRSREALRIYPNAAATASKRDPLPGNAACATTAYVHHDPAPGDSDANDHAGNSAAWSHADADGDSQADFNAAPAKRRNDAAWRAKPVPNAHSASNSNAEPRQEGQITNANAGSKIAAAVRLAQRRADSTICPAGAITVRFRIGKSVVFRNPHKATIAAMLKNSTPFENRIAIIT